MVIYRSLQWRIQDSGGGGGHATSKTTSQPNFPNMYDLILLDFLHCPAPVGYLWKPGNPIGIDDPIRSLKSIFNMKTLTS